MKVSRNSKATMRMYCIMEKFDEIKDWAIYYSPSCRGSTHAS